MITMIIAIVMAMVVGVVGTCELIRDIKLVYNPDWTFYTKKKIPVMVLVVYTFPVWTIFSAVYQVIAAIVNSMAYNRGSKFEIKNEIVPFYGVIFTNSIYYDLYRFLTRYTCQLKWEEMNRIKIETALEETIEATKNYANKKWNRQTVLNAYKNLKKLTSDYDLKYIFKEAKKNHIADKEYIRYMKELATIKDVISKEDLKKRRFYIQINRQYVY